jgi:hypothetical protein
MIHTETCIGYHAEYAAMVAAFEAAHPNYCRACGGWGYTMSTGCSVPYGSTNVNLPDEADPCSKCADEGKCPICGAVALNDDGSACAECGWDAEACDGLPEGPECDCWASSDNQPEETLTDAALYAWAYGDDVGSGYGKDLSASDLPSYRTRGLY